jgi:hypothetical protein
MKSIVDRTANTLSSVASEKVFVQLRYGANKSMLLNPCCAAGNLLETIKQQLAGPLQVAYQLEMNRDTVLDLADVTGAWYTKLEILRITTYLYTAD